MARFFNDGLSQYLEYAGIVVSAEPITIAAWVYSDDDTIAQNICAINDASADRGWSLQLRGNVAGDKVCWYARGDTTVVAVNTTTGYSVNTWHHVCGISAADNDHRVYIDGSSKGTSSTDIGLASGLDVTVIGAHAVTGGHSKCMSGRIGGPCIYDVALTDAEVLSLALGESPLRVRPASLVAYWPLIRDEDQDRVGGYHMTPVASPTVAAHTPKIKPYWFLPFVFKAPSAAVETLSISITPDDSSYWKTGPVVVGSP